LIPLLGCGKKINALKGYSHAGISSGGHFSHRQVQDSANKAVIYMFILQTYGQASIPFHHSTSETRTRRH
jgi:hypothetical protein